MAKTKRCLGVDLGGQSVKLAEMAIDRGGLRVVRLLEAPVPVGPDAQPAERQQALAGVVRDLVKSNKIATKNAVFSIPGQTVFVKRQTLPRATPTQLQRIVQIEARQQIPFPLEKMTLEYQVFDTEDDRHVEVLLAAMKRESNQEYMRMFRSTGLRVSGISISSLALYNGQELRQFDVSAFERQSSGAGLLGKLGSGKGKAPRKKKKKPDKGAEGGGVSLEDEAAAMVDEGAGEMVEDLALAPSGEFEEVSAFVNIGARSTDLAIGKSGMPRSVGFVRSIPLGGNHMTQAVFKACDCETFTQAEKIKVERSAIQSASFEFEADPSQYDEKACQAVTVVGDRIVAELRRSLDYYISQPDGAAVDLLVLSGGGARTAFLSGYIEERLGLPVQVSSGLGNDGIKTPSQYSSDFDFSSYRIALGLASQGLGISPIDVDFLPSDVRGARDLGAQSVELVVLAGLLGVMVFFGSQVGKKSLRYWQGEAMRYSGQVEKQRPMTRTIAELKKRHEAVQGRLQSLSSRLEPRDFWLRVLREVQKVKPPEVLVTRLDCEVDPLDPWGGRVRIQAQAERQSALTDFARELRGLQPYVRSAGDVLIPKIEPGVKSKHFTKPVQQMRVNVSVRERGDGQVVRVPPDVTPVPKRGGGGSGGEPGMEGEGMM